MRDILRIEAGAGHKDLFSIIVPVLNNAQQLQRCIDSFAEQTEKNKELIIVDGGSTDGTLEILYKNRHLIAQSDSTQDSGIYAAFNRGVCLSQGEWILFLGSDDVFFEKELLEKAKNFIQHERSGQKIVYGKVAILGDHQEVVDVRGGPWSSYQHTPIGKWTFEHQGIFHHRSLFEEHGLFDESFRICGDHELLLRELKSGEALFLEGMIVAGFALGGASSLPKNLKQMIMEKEKALYLNNIMNERVASRRLKWKIAIYEFLRSSFGLEFADSMSRYVNKLRGR